MKKILTIILDGFGYREEIEGNAIRNAKMNTFNNLWQEYPHTLLQASEEAVGLGKGQAGNSEVGHMTIGAGRLLRQNGTIVKDFLDNPDINKESVSHLLSLKDKDVHLMGLCSDGFVHSNMDCFIKLYNFLVDNGFTKIHFHLITDGRDTGVNDSPKYIKMIKDTISSRGIGNIASVCGRYYAMDRDKNYDRIKLYYDLVVHGKGISSINIDKTINSFYEKGITDEFMKPIVCSNSTIKNNDVLIWVNYREDRAREILDSLVNYDDFQGFAVNDMSNLEVFSFLPVDKRIKTQTLTEPEMPKNPLGVYLSELDFMQARIAETEKYAHVTYFFDGGVESKLNGCDKFLIPSPKVATYDLKPEMSAVEVTKKVISSMDKDYDFILVNFANPDMVGHTGNMEATILACDAVDLCLASIMEKAEENFYKVIILADHGNADTMINPDGSPCTTHTTALVPFIVCDKKVVLKDGGSLVNVAPTILDYMDIAIPKEMGDSESLLVEE